MTEDANGGVAVAHSVDGIKTEAEADVNGHVNGEAKTTFDESYMPIPNLQFCSEQDGYRYYVDPLTQKQYSLDSAGYWYVLNEQGLFELVDNEMDAIKNLPRSKDIPYDEDGLPVFPKNQNGLPVLPRNDKEQPIFPLDSRGNPVFPFDKEARQWIFPVDDCEDPIFPRTAEGHPIVPQDRHGRAVFPKDKTGNFIFPLDENHCPCPALTTDNKRVIPYDDFGNPVVPQDREGKPLIQFSEDGTPMSIAEYKLWRQYQKQQKNYKAPVLKSNMKDSIDSPYHPLNIAHQASLFMAEMEILQRGRRTRPEDIDLPDFNNIPMAEAENSMDATVNQIITEDEKAIKRRKFLEAQLRASKKVEEKKEVSGEAKPSKSVQNPFAKDKGKSKKEKEKDRSPESRYKTKKTDRKKRYDEKDSKDRKRRHRRHSESDTESKRAKHRRSRKRSESSSSSSSDSSSASGSSSSSQSDAAPAKKRKVSPPRKRSRSRSNTYSPLPRSNRRSDYRKDRDTSKYNGRRSKKEDRSPVKKENRAPSREGKKERAKTPTGNSDMDMDVSDTSRPPSPAQPTAAELEQQKQAQIEEETRRQLKANELIAVRGCITDAQKSYDRLVAEIAKLQKEKDEQGTLIECLREQEKRLLS